MDLVKNKDAQKVLTWITDRYRITTTQHTFLESLLENTDTHVEYPYVPEMIEFYLGKNPILNNVPTFQCRKPDDLAYTLANLEKACCQTNSWRWRIWNASRPRILEGRD